MGFWQDIRLGWKAYRAMKRFQALPPEARERVVYVEDSASYVYLGAILQVLNEKYQQSFCYLTSEFEDEDGKKRGGVNVHRFYIGEGWVRTLLFRTIDCKVLIMTMPDLETFHLKRSVNPVHYVYVFHSLVSTHMIYRKGAFDAYDTVFCCGPHHVKEIRETERIYELTPKKLVEQGYGRLDEMLGAKTSYHAATHPRVLIAPSWGTHGILEVHGVTLVKALIEAGCQVWVRPHPMTRKKAPQALEALQTSFGDHPHFKIESGITAWNSFVESDVMISDWSGAALEYAFGLEKPVLFIDVPRKINNPEYEKISHQPIEVSIRPEIGKLIPISEIPQIGVHVREMIQAAEAWRERLKDLREKHVFNVGHSGQVGAEALMGILKNSA